MGHVSCEGEASGAHSRLPTPRSCPLTLAMLVSPGPSLWLPRPREALFSPVHWIRRMRGMHSAGSPVSANALTLPGGGSAVTKMAVPEGTVKGSCGCGSAPETSFACGHRLSCPPVLPPLPSLRSPISELQGLSSEGGKGRGGDSLSFALSKL